MKIGELSKKCGLSIDTLRFYEKIGLLEKPLRDGGGHRVYDPEIMQWLGFLARLKETDMPLKKQIEYAKLRAMGNETAALRRILLEKHLQELTEKQARLKDNISTLKTKITIYRQIEKDIDDDEPKSDT
ncbi:MerR family transcriptional regulator [Pseudaquidulcibacter saccharophilus]|uniref:MerR family transcriptional regulator n=1 Tax=Pseudaquidulcibacter saccharophilus TaxID=2831900 RepID=UPI001EFF4EAB|nr:MerR family transcriptional regulator [Pseudaquidulcibacter saccharophilus]